MDQANITLQDIVQAHKRIQNYIYRTPLEYNEKISNLYNSNIYLKLENLQITGSFKAREAFNGLLSLSDVDRKRGVIAPSAGNHGIGLAYAAKRLNVPAYVCLPRGTDESKVNALESYGAVISYFDSIEEARLSAIEASKENGYKFFSAYNAPTAITAGGTIALEVLDDLSDVDTVITCMGGGGLTAGMCIALKSVNPKIKIWGIQPKNSPTLEVWHRNGSPTDVDLKPSIAEGLSGPIEPETITFPIIHKYIDRILTVTEVELIDAVRMMMDSHYIAEPSGAAGIAALKRYGKELTGCKVAILVTGRNISWSRLTSLME